VYEYVGSVFSPRFSPYSYTYSYTRISLTLRSSMQHDVAGSNLQILGNVSLNRFSRFWDNTRPLSPVFSRSIRSTILADDLGGKMGERVRVRGNAVKDFTRLGLGVPVGVVFVCGSWMRW
jgi:hypothetical protein